jgi:hypothetical protein
MSQPIKGEKKPTFINRCLLEQKEAKNNQTEKEHLETCNRVWETHAREALSNYVKTFQKK